MHFTADNKLLNVLLGRVRFCSKEYISSNARNVISEYGDAERFEYFLRLYVREGWLMRCVTNQYFTLVM